MRARAIHVEGRGHRGRVARRGDQSVGSWLRSLSRARVLPYLSARDPMPGLVYHRRLVSDLLRKRLSKIQPDLLSALHRQASEWYEKNALITDAVSHALASGNVDRVARLVEGNALVTISHGELTTLVSRVE